MTPIALRQKNGAAQTATVIGQFSPINAPVTGRLRFKGTDNFEIDNNSPIIKPGSTVRSMEKWLRLYMPSAPVVSITNPRFYTDGVSNLGIGVTLYVRTTNPGSFSTPAVPVDDSAGTNAFTYTSAAKKSLDAVNTGPFSTPGDFGDYLVLWLSISSAVVPTGKIAENVIPFELLRFTWDEN